jgi:hypothetical protein
MISAVPGVSDGLSTTGSPIVPDGAGAAQQRVDQLEHHPLRPVEKIEVRDRASFLSERVNALWQMRNVNVSGLPDSNPVMLPQSTPEAGEARERSRDSPVGLVPTVSRALSPHRKAVPARS